MVDYQKLKNKKDELKRLAEHNEQEANKRKLTQDIERHIRTVFIGALSDVEEELGWLWGHGKNKEDLTQEELEEREHWDKVRNSILNRGNNKLRAAVDEISKYTIGQERFQASFKFQD